MNILVFYFSVENTGREASRRTVDQSVILREWILRKLKNPSVIYERVLFFCGEYRSRTGDLLHAMQAL